MLLNCELTRQTFSSTWKVFLLSDFHPGMKSAEFGNILQRISCQADWRCLQFFNSERKSIYNSHLYYGIFQKTHFLGKYKFTNPSKRAGCNTRSILKWSLTVFLLLDWLPYESWRTQFALLFNYSCRENNRIHTFPKGISAMWNTISLIQDLN